MMNQRTYLKIEQVKARPFTESMATGFATRYGIDNGDGSYSTYAFPTGGDGEEELKVPYITCPVTQRQILAGDRYMVIESDDGALSVMPTHIFERTYSDAFFPSESDIEEQAKDIFEPDVSEYNNVWASEIYKEGATWAIEEMKRRI
jgi:hypothetical protein